MLRPPGFRPAPAAPTTARPTGTASTKSAQTAAPAGTKDGFQSAPKATGAGTNLAGGVTVSALPKLKLAHLAVMNLKNADGTWRKLTEKDINAMLPEAFKGQFAAMSAEDKAEFLDALQAKMPELTRGVMARSMILDWVLSALGANVDHRKDMEGFEGYTGGADAGPTEGT